MKKTLSENNVDSELSSSTSRGKSKRKEKKNEEKVNDFSKEKKKNDKKKNVNKEKKINTTKKVGIYKNKIKFLVDNIVIILIILSFILLISFKYLEEKYSIESYLEDEDTFDYYEVLKCKRGDDVQKIKKNYRDLSKLYHPDSNKNCKDCEKKFQEITKAYKTLSDSRLKKAYDNSRGKVLKLIESNSINLNEKNFIDLVENSNDYWIIQIYSDTDSLCLSFSKIWEESFDKYHEYIKFGRINISTDKKLVKKKIPFNVKIYPTIFILSPDGSYQLYSNIFNATSKDFQNFILNNYPNYIFNIIFFNKSFQNKDEYKVKQTYVDKNHKVILLTNKTKLSLQVKQVSYKFNNTYPTYAIKYDEIGSITNDTLKKSIIDSLKVLSIKKDEYIKENENLDYFLLVNSNQVNVIRRISPNNIKNVYYDSLKKNFVEINSNNVDSICSTVGSRHTYCYVIFIDSIEDEQTLNYIKKCYQHINSSYNQFVAKLGNEEIDEQFFIQPVYVLKKNLTKNFMKFINESTINKYDSFFLDFSSNSFAVINEIKNLSDYSQKKDDVSFLSKIYKDIEILNFEKIPKYCVPFNINCLYNVKTTLLYKIYNILKRTTKTQIVISILVAYILMPFFKQYGRTKYIFLTFSIILSIFAINLKDFFMLFYN
ncbi:DnaJ protein, putative [Plasmodium gallinaceum]|uniref:DnaJ protein, putative n=1 Tax=Plasmodium gallinaceum TaxID=5849 RepID=A0A1J1GM05_PLAGA|nr:DnaJ protein, putative [Plasmodium gallinaceum]CRG93464.1 DnaJ protein, putative [Plasmodium gallinaceum]